MAIIALAPNSPRKGIVNFSRKTTTRVPPITWLVLDNSLSSDEIRQGDTIYFCADFDEINNDGIYLIYLKLKKDWIVARLLQTSGDLIVFRWSNPDYPPQLVESKDIEVQGVMVNTYLHLV